MAVQEKDRSGRRGILTPEMLRALNEIRIQRANSPGKTFVASLLDIPPVRDTTQTVLEVGSSLAREAHIGLTYTVNGLNTLIDLARPNAPLGNLETFWEKRVLETIADPQEIDYYREILRSKILDTQGGISGNDMLEVADAMIHLTNGHGYIRKGASNDTVPSIRRTTYARDGNTYIVQTQKYYADDHAGRVGLVGRNLSGIVIFERVDGNGNRERIHTSDTSPENSGRDEIYHAVLSPGPKGTVVETLIPSLVIETRGRFVRGQELQSYWIRSVTPERASSLVRAVISPFLLSPSFLQIEYRQT